MIISKKMSAAPYLRSTLVINPDGSVVIARYNVRAKGHVDSLLKALDKLEK